MKKLLPAIFVSLFLLFIAPKAVHASTLYLSPASGQVGTGSTLVVTVRLDTKGEQTNAVSAYLSYPADKFDVAYINSAGSAFPITAEESGGGGSIKITRGSTSAVTGSNLFVAKFGLKAKALGSGTVYFVGGSHVPRFSDNGETLDLNATKGGTFTVVGASAVASASPKSSSKDVIPPVISDIAVADTTTSSATITWKTNENADSLIEFGTATGQYIGSTSDSSLTTSHSLKITGDQLQPGLKLYYKIQSKDAAGNQATSDEQSVQLKGYQVTISVVDGKNAPVKGAEVFIYPEPPLKITSDDKGQAVFNNVTVGKHQVVVRVKDQDTQSEISVADSTQPQNFTVKINLKAPSLFDSFKINPLSVGAILIILVTAGVLIFLLMKNKKNLKDAENYVSASATPPVDLGPQAQSSDDNPVVTYREKK